MTRSHIVVCGLFGWLGTVASGWCVAQAAGPDIAIGDINGFLTIGRVADPEGDLWGLMFGKTDCNLGDAPIDVFADSSQHPVVAEHLYRFATINNATRFEQIGMSHVFHEFFPLQGILCHPGCTPDINTSRLGARCSSPDSASAMAQPRQLGPRDEVNAFTGQFAFPYRSLDDASPIAERIQVRDQDLRPSLNPGARYVAEAHVIAPDDAAAGNGTNNASYRFIAVSGGSTTINLAPYPGSTTQRGQPAIFAWGALDPGVRMSVLDVPGEGQFHVAWRVTPIGPCRWHYEYAIQNINSDRGGASVVLPVKARMSISGVGFHGPERHSEDRHGDAPWMVSRTPTTLAWSAPADYATDPNTSALRWGTLYNFRFDAPHPPVSGEAVLALFKPGTTERVVFVLDVPGGCPADTDDGTGMGTPDCGVTIDDLLYYLGVFGEGASRADMDDGTGSGTPDGGVTIEDLLYYLERFAAGC